MAYSCFHSIVRKQEIGYTSFFISPIDTININIIFIFSLSLKNHSK